MGDSMRISIFSKSNTSDYKKEYLKIIKVLSSKCITLNNNSYNYFNFINKYLFNSWNYRGTYLDLYEYLESIDVIFNNKKIVLDNLLNLIEFLMNMQLMIESSKYYNKNISYSIKCRSILFHNIPLILEKYNYEAYNIDDKVYIYKKDLMYDDLLEELPDDVSELILMYSSINNIGIKQKRLLLEKIYLYLDKYNDKYKKLNSPIYNTIKLVITKMGVIGNIDKKYTDITNYKLKKYYDYCFDLIIYLMKTENILKYKEEIKNYNSL